MQLFRLFHRSRHRLRSRRDSSVPTVRLDLYDNSLASALIKPNAHDVGPRLRCGRRKWKCGGGGVGTHPVHNGRGQRGYMGAQENAHSRPRQRPIGLTQQSSSVAPASRPRSLQAAFCQQCCALRSEGRCHRLGWCVIATVLARVDHHRFFIPTTISAPDLSVANIDLVPILLKAASHDWSIRRLNPYAPAESCAEDVDPLHLKWADTLFQPMVLPSNSADDLYSLFNDSGPSAATVRLDGSRTGPPVACCPGLSGS